MFLNYILSKVQSYLHPIYAQSLFLKSIDCFIGVSIFLVIFLSVFAGSDSIGYFALFTVILTFIKLLTKSGEKFELNLADRFLLLYFLIVVISVAGSSLFYLSLKGFFKTFIYLGFYVSLIHYLRSNKSKVKYIFMAFALCAGIEVIAAILQNFVSVGEISGWQDTTRLNPEEVMTRVYGTLKPYNPNLFGGYMLAILPSFIAFFQKNKFFSLSGTVLTIIAIVLTGCRGAYIALFFELFILGLIIYNKLSSSLKDKFIRLSACATTLMTLVILSISSLKARIFSIFAMRGDSSNSFRFNVYHSCLDMFKDNWLLGIGVGNQNFREIYGLYMRTGFDALSAYNIYLEIAVESGIFALITFIGFIVVVIKNAIKNTNSLFVLAALISIVGILIHGCVDTVFFRPQIQFTFWIMIAIIQICHKDLN